MKEFATIIRTQYQIDRHIPTGHFKEIRQMSPEEDLILPEDMFARQLTFLNTDTKVLVLLLASFTDKTTPAAVRHYIDSLSPNQQAVVGKSNVEEAMTRFEEEGMLVSERVGKYKHYSKPPGMDCFAAQAGYLLGFSNEYEASLRQVFGRSESSRRRANRDEAIDLSTQHVKDRLDMIKAVYSAKKGNNPYLPLPITIEGIATDLGVSSDLARRHMRDLVGAGMLTLKTIDPNSPYQTYLFENNRELSAQKRKGRYAVGRVVLEYVRNNPSFTSADVVEYITEMVAKGEGFSEDELSMHGIKDISGNGLGEVDAVVIISKVRKVIAHLRDEKIISAAGQFDRDKKSVIHFEPRTTQLAQMRDLITTLFDARREDSLTERNGVKLAQNLIGDRECMAKIVLKIARDNKRLSQVGIQDISSSQSA